jgi:plasmid maintenance system killer protein
MILHYTRHFKARIKQRIKKNPALKKKIASQLEIFYENPKHPSLRLHKLRGRRINQYSIWIEENLRITFIKEKQNDILTDIITHDQY